MYFRSVDGILLYMYFRSVDGILLYSRSTLEVFLHHRSVDGILLYIYFRSVDGILLYIYFRSVHGILHLLHRSFLNKETGKFRFKVKIKGYLSFRILVTIPKSPYFPKNVLAKIKMLFKLGSPLDHST